MIIYGENGKPLVNIGDTYLDKALCGDSSWKNCFHTGFKCASICMNLKVPESFEEGYEMYTKGLYNKFKPFQELSLQEIVALGTQGKLYSLDVAEWSYIKGLIGESNE